MSDALSTAAATPPGPRGSAILGSLADFRDDRLGFLLRTAQQHGSVAAFRLGVINAYLVSSPAGVKRVLQDNNDAYGRRTQSHTALRATLGEGLITSEGTFWRRQRRIAQPAFHKQRLTAFASIMREGAVAMTQRWRGAAERCEAIDLVPEFLRVTLEILGRALFGRDLAAAADTVGRSLSTVLHHTIDQAQAFVPVPEAIPTPRNLRFRAARRQLDAVVLGLIAERRAAGGDTGDLLSMLLSSRDEETGEGMTDRQIRDEVMTLMLAGHETTAMTLAWTAALLSRHPGERRVLEAEVDAALGGRAPTLEDLPSLPLTKMVIEESMRLYPPAWVVVRSLSEGDVIDGYQLKPGTVVFVSPWVTHRDPTLWENPEGFDPQRFAPGRDEERPRYAYFPFGGGPHLCIGAAFAMMEAQIVLATAVSRYQMDLVPGHPVEPEALVTLRPRHGIRVTLRIR